MLFNVLDFQNRHGAPLLSGNNPASFRPSEQQRQNAVDHQVEHGGVEQGPDHPFFDVGLAHPDDLVHRDDTHQGGVLDQGDELVAHGRDDPLDHLQQRHLEKDLALGHAQHLAGLILAFGDGLDAAAVDLGEIAGVVDDEGQQRRPEPRQQRQVKQKARPVKMMRIWIIRGVPRTTHTTVLTSQRRGVIRLMAPRAMTRPRGSANKRVRANISGWCPALPAKSG